MILEQVAMLLEQIYRHMSYHSNCLEQIVGKVNSIDNVVGKPSGKVTFRGAIDFDPKELQKAFRQRRELEVDKVRMEFAYDQKVYLGINPALHDEMKQMFDESQLTHLRNTLEAYQHLTEVIFKAEQQAEELVACSLRSQAEMNIDIREMVEAQTKEEKKRLQLEVKKVTDLKGKIKVGLKVLNEAIADTRNLQAEAGNITLAAKPPDRQIKMIKA